MADFPTDQEINQTFPDNTTGEIGADDMRAFQKDVSAAGDSKLSPDQVLGGTGITVTDNNDGTITVDADDSGGVTSFNTRDGAVVPVQADYDEFFTTPAEVAAVTDPIAADVAINTSAITAVDGKADTNAGNIATNTGDIATNASAITSLEGKEIPTGGNAGQLLAKASTTPYDTEWVDASAGGGDVTSFNGRTGAVVPLQADYDGFFTTPAEVAAITDPIAADVATNTSAITAVDGKADTNAGNIATNTGDIATNASAITAVDGKADANAGNIATNTGDIATNAAAITAVDGKADTNAGDIATNASAITAVDGKADANAAAITAVDGKADTNAGNIATNTAALGGYSLEVVAALPGTPDADTIYFVTT